MINGLKSLKKFFKWIDQKTATCMEASSGSVGLSFF